MMRHSLVGLLTCVAASVGVGCTTHAARGQSSGAPAPRGGAAHREVQPLADAAVAIDVNGLAAGDAAALAAIGRAIGDAQVVMLGEPWHGDGGAIRARTGLVRYLHERLGFDVLVYEADFYSLASGWPEARTAPEVAALGRDNVYAFWSASAAGAPLWQYLGDQRAGAHPLEVAGVDIRHTGRRAQTTLAPALRARWPRELSDADTAAFFATLGHLLTEERGYRPAAGELPRFLGVLDRLAAAWEGGGTAEDQFWAQEARNLGWSARFAWAGASRDRGMGENFRWLATHHYAGRKMIVWAHNNHLIGNPRMYVESPDTLVAPQVAQMTPARRDSLWYFGSTVKALFGTHVFTIAEISYTGSYSPEITSALRGYRDSTSVPRYLTAFDSTEALAPTPDESLEAALAARGLCAAFVDLRPFAGRAEPVRARALSFSPYGYVAMRYWVGYDAFLFLRRTAGLNEPQPACR
jgi:erythromycin esterase-like protein